MYRLIMWGVLFVPFLYVLLLPPIYHLSNVALERVDNPRIWRVLSDVRHACAAPYRAIMENAPLDIEMPLFEYDVWWRERCSGW
jgi:hypothetical protein